MFGPREPHLPSYAQPPQAQKAAGAERICLWVDFANPFGAKKLYYSEGYVDRYVSHAYAKDE